MGIGLGVLGMPPAVFWALTPRELDAALRGRFGSGACGMPLSHDELQDLMASFPD